MDLFKKPDEAKAAQESQVAVSTEHPSDDLINTTATNIEQIQLQIRTLEPEILEVPKSGDNPRFGSPLGLWRITPRAQRRC